MSLDRPNTETVRLRLIPMRTLRIDTSQILLLLISPMTTSGLHLDPPLMTAREVWRSVKTRVQVYTFPTRSSAPHLD